MTARRLARHGAVLLARGALPACASACSVCFSDPASVEGAARNWAVVSLLLFIVPVLGVIGWTGWTWIRREQAAEVARVTLPVSRAPPDRAPASAARAAR